MVSTASANVRRIRKWPGWQRAKSVAIALLLLVVAAARPEHPGIHMALGRIVVIIVAMSLAIRGEDRYQLLSAGGMIGFGLIWLIDTRLGWALPLAGGGMFLIGLALWWIDNCVPDD